MSIRKSTLNNTVIITKEVQLKTGKEQVSVSGIECYYEKKNKYVSSNGGYVLVSSGLCMFSDVNIGDITGSNVTIEEQTFNVVDYQKYDRKGNYHHTELRLK